MVAGLDAEGPVVMWKCRLYLPQLFGELGQLAFELGQLMLGVWICCTGWYPTVDDVSDLLSRILGVLGLVQQFAILASSTMRDLVQVDSAVSELRQELSQDATNATESPLDAALPMRFAKSTQHDTSKVLRLPRKMTMDTSKVLRLPLNLQRIFGLLFLGTSVSYSQSLTLRPQVRWRWLPVSETPARRFSRT